ncbi:MAG TPA: hypothetical protein DEP45_08290 [Armatimonadetes bacterium]|mgnify:CR=1 FL=1|nr:hypothetical protein [Armatimonadota bacterium]
MRCVMAMIQCSLLLAAAASSLVVGQAEAQQLPLEQLREVRRELAHQPRGIIANNDGCDCLYYPKDREISVQNFLDLRTTALADSQVSSVAYTTISSGFSFFTHDTNVGTVLTREPEDFGLLPNTRNATQPLIDLGSDCLKSVLDFCHANGMECFWSMRMNDTHDVAWAPDKPYLLYPPLKEEHPEWLVGAPDRRGPVGRWSSVNYALEEVRDLAFGYLEEVCRNYDVDGIELDFLRHLCYFASVASGGVATEEEVEAMTGLMRRVRAMTEEVGLERGRPILVSMRVPDSVEMSRECGLDIERWLEEGLLDILITSDYFRLNPWEYSVELGQRYGVAVYPCLTDSRVTGETRYRRKSAASYRGRAMNAWAAGADGMHTFNLFNPTSEIFRQVGDPASMATLDKLYYATAVDGLADRWLVGGERHRTLRMLAPSQPASISPGAPVRMDIMIGEDFALAREQGGEPTVTLSLELPGVSDPGSVHAGFNGHPLEGGTMADGWLDLPLQVEWIERGRNSVEVSLDESAAPAKDEWRLVWEATERPQAPWHRDPGSARTEDALQDGAMLIADRGTVSGDYHFFRYDWAIAPEEQTVVEAQAKVISGGSFVIVTNGKAQERLALYPDHIELFFNTDIRYDMDTTDNFHSYRIVSEGEDLKVYVDGELRLDATGRFVKGGTGAKQLAFGAANSTDVGEALWRSVRARFAGQACRDMLVTVNYE